MPHSARKSPVARRDFLKHAAVALAALSTGAHGAERAPEEEVADRGAPALENAGSTFSLILLPDPHYARYEETQPLLDICLAWVGANIERLKIKGVLCPGDIVQHNNAAPDGYGTRQTSAQQWQAVSRSFERLDGRVPYIISLGNHDYGFKGAENSETQYAQYFPKNRNTAPQMRVVETFPNAMGEADSLENAAYEFSTVDPNWWEMLIVCLEYLPRDETLEWVKRLANNPKYKKHRIVLLTHSYLDARGELTTRDKIGGRKSFNTGKDIWEKLVYTTPAICMVLSGHCSKVKEGYAGNVSRRVSKNCAGKDVFQMMFNAQTEGYSFFGNGGDGWLRILEFLPDGNTLSVRTYSPLHGISALNRGHSWRVGDCDDFRVFIPNRD